MNVNFFGQRPKALLMSLCFWTCCVGNRLGATPLLQVLGPEEMTKRELLKNGGFEGESVEDWQAWEEGFEAAPGQGRNGSDAVRCVAEDPNVEYGAGQRVVLNQEEPLSLLAAGYSMSQNVDDPVGSGYSVYVDLLYKDGSHLWAQSAPFDVGTHTWQRKEVLIRPEKPVRELLVYGLFRGHTGTVFFDDFTLEEWTPPKGTFLFDRLSVLPGEEGLPLSGPRILLRDVKSGSDLCVVEGLAEGLRQEGRGRCEELDLDVDVNVSSEDDTRLLDLGLEDVRSNSKTRFVTLYVAVPVRPGSWVWHHDMRRSETVDKTREAYGICRFIGVGAHGLHSLYPLSVISNESGFQALAVPPGLARYYRFFFNPKLQALVLAFDVALSDAPDRFPRCADFQALLFQGDGTWGFRSALESYYQLCSRAFEKRVPREGLWMPFTDIATVAEPEDFHFAFQEGAPNPAWDEAHHVLSFPYVEPMTHWIPLPPEVERTHEGAEGFLASFEIAEGKATQISCAWDKQGRPAVDVLHAPWCDGCVFALNANLNLSGHVGTQCAGRLRMQSLLNRVDRSGLKGFVGWSVYEEGYRAANGKGRRGSTCLELHKDPLTIAAGARQTVQLSREKPFPLRVEGWVSREDVTGKENIDFSVYVDIIYADGTPLWGQVARLSPGSGDWEKVTLDIQPEKPVRDVHLHLLLRGQHLGRARFDDFKLTEEGRPDNLLINGDFEKREGLVGELDGVYVDSLEGWKAVKNFRSSHFDHAETPLLFGPSEEGPFQLTIYSTYAFCRRLQEEMRTRNKFTFANAALWEFAFLAPLFDIMGTETNWKRQGQWQPDSDEIFCFRRSLCYQKPYCLLQNTDFESWKKEDTERYILRCLFYGCFPGMFSRDAATHPYFTEPAWYERDRTLFAKFLPWIQRIAKAGWEPVTQAWAEGSEIWLERYGPNEYGPLYLAALNPSDGTERARFVVDVSAVGAKDAEISNALESLPVEKVKGSEEETPGLIRFQDVLESQEVSLYEIRLQF